MKFLTMIMMALFILNPSFAWAASVTPGSYEAEDDGINFKLELNADGTGSYLVQSDAFVNHNGLRWHRINDTKMDITVYGEEYDGSETFKATIMSSISLEFDDIVFTLKETGANIQTSSIMSGAKGRVGIAIKGFQLGMSIEELLAQADKLGIKLSKTDFKNFQTYMNMDLMLADIKDGIVVNLSFYHASRYKLFNVNPEVSCEDFARQFADAYGIGIKRTLKERKKIIADQARMEDIMIPMTVFDKVPIDKDWKLEIVCSPVFKGIFPAGRSETIIELSTTQNSTKPAFD